MSMNRDVAVEVQVVQRKVALRVSNLIYSVWLKRRCERGMLSRMGVAVLPEDTGEESLGWRPSWQSVTVMFWKLKCPKTLADLALSVLL